MQHFALEKRRVPLARVMRIICRIIVYLDCHSFGTFLDKLFFTSIFYFIKAISKAIFKGSELLQILLNKIKNINFLKIISISLFSFTEIKIRNN